MKFRLRYVIPFLLTLLFSLSACITFTHCSDDKPTQPPDTLKPLDTTSHEFVWEVDTLFYEGTNTPVYLDAHAMYAANSNNVYLVGFTNTTNEMCWHWDGNSWKTFNLYPQLLNALIDVDGIDSTFVVFLGFDEGNAKYSSIMALDNGNLHAIPLPQGTGKRTCLRVESREEIYLGGFDGVQKYNNGKWEWLFNASDRVALNEGEKFSVLDILKVSNNIILFTTQLYGGGGPTKCSLWKYDGLTSVFVDSFYTNEQGMKNIRFGYHFDKYKGEIISCSKGGVFAIRDGVFTRIMDQGGGHGCGKPNDLFLTGGYDLIHFNGSTWSDVITELERSYQSLNLQYVNTLCYVDTVLFTCLQSNGIPLIFRGKRIR